jgi:hypothetical protein
MDDIAIVETSEQHIDGFHRCVGIVARERKYIALVDSPPIESTRAFVRSVIEGHGAHFVAIDADGEVTPPSGGVVNMVYRVATSSGATYALRLYPDDGDARSADESCRRRNSRR